MRGKVEGGGESEIAREGTPHELAPGKQSLTGLLGHPSSAHPATPGKRTLTESVVAPGLAPPSFASLLAPFGFLGRMGPGGGTGLPGPRSPQLDAFQYFEKHGEAHFKELLDMQLGDPTLETGSPYATWEAGSSKVFVEQIAHELYLGMQARPWDLAEQTLAPASLWKLVDTGRDAENQDDPAQANEHHLGVTLELQKAYRERLREALARLMPRLIREWNRRTVADHAERSKDASVPIPEHPETNQPGLGILQSHPIDRFVLGALWSLTRPTLKPDFAAYRKAFPAEAKPNGSRDGDPVADTLRKVQFQWQSPNQARRWIKVTDPIDATPEEVAKELLGDTHLTYLITSAAPLFGFDPTQHVLRPEHERAYAKLYDDGSPGGDVAHELLAGPQADDAALNQAAAFTAAKASKPAVLQQFDLAIDQLKTVAASTQSWVTLDKDVQEAIARAEQRKQKIADATDLREADKWNAQIREQLDIASKCERGLGIVGKLYHSIQATEPRELAHEIGTLFVKAAGHSDLVVTARQELDQANQRLLAFPADWVEVQFRWIRRAILASQKNARTGQDDSFVKLLDERETKLRLELMQVRNKLLTNPLAVERDLERITQELQELATGAAAARNLDLCDEAFVAVKEAKSATGWIRSLASNPITGDHGNDRLDALAGRAEKFQGEWSAIQKQWKAGDKQGAADALERKAKSDEWKQLFQDVAKEIKDQAKYDAWMTFAILVGVAVVTGFTGALLEPVAAAAVGPVLGFVVTATTEAALFTTLSYFLVERHPSLQGFAHEFGKNVVVFGGLKGISKLFAGLEQLLALELTEAELIAQFATINGIALHEANQEKAKRGETLSEAEILKISLDNLIFTMAVALGGKALAPALGRWRVKAEVGKGLREIDALYEQVTSLAEQVKATKDKAAAQKLLEKQRELLTAERELLEGLLELTQKGRDHALKQGMTAAQYDALMGAQKDLASATRGLREAELLGKLEPITQGQYLCEPGKTFDEARDHYAGDKANQIGDVVTDTTNGTRSFEVRLPDGSTLRISERAGEPGEVTTRTRPVATAGGEPPASRAEEVAKAHGLSDPAALLAFEALYKAQPKELLTFLDALKSQPGLAGRLLAQLGESTLTHVRPAGEHMISIHGELEISPKKLGSLSDADIAKLALVCKNKGPVEAFEYFEATSTKGGQPGARLRFQSRLASRANEVITKILESIKMDRSDPRAKIFDGMREGDAIRLWDLVNERAYKDATIRRQAAEWAFSKNPANARELVAEFQFYDAEISNRRDKIYTEAKAELQNELARREAAKGSPLTEAEARLAIQQVTKAKLGKSFDVDGPAWGKQATIKALEEMAQTKTGTDGKPTTVGAEAADAAWRTNLEAQKGSKAAGSKNIGVKSDAELLGHVKSIADTLGFGTNVDGAYHAHKHARELSSKPPPAIEMETYLQAARDFIRTKNGVVRHNQNGSRSVVFEAEGMRAIVSVSADGNASIATFGKASN
ncbi:MAG TPA: hypothetical protein VNO30_13240 [Kofleriaceae bacterium]|nr:hypothetical protein [Kofleriaceae bacterium]